MCVYYIYIVYNIYTDEVDMIRYMCFAEGEKNMK